MLGVPTCLYGTRRRVMAPLGGGRPLRRSTGGCADYGRCKHFTVALGDCAGIATEVLPFRMTAGSATSSLGDTEAWPRGSQRERSFATLTARSRPSRSVPLSSEIAVSAPS